jgi:hypothetical protein
MIESLRLAGVTSEIAHLLERFPPGMRDTEWIPQIAVEGWIVVSCDRGSHSKAGEKLPQLCAEYGVSHVVMSRGMSNRTMHFRMLAVQSLWAEIVAVKDAPRGFGYSLYLANDTPRLKAKKPPAASRAPETRKDQFPNDDDDRSAEKPA